MRVRDPARENSERVEESEKSRISRGVVARPHKPVHVFYSYSHRDERHRKVLGNHLSVLRREGLIDDWCDRNISPGQEWEKAIDAHLETADIIVLLVSVDFVASPYCQDRELARALERNADGEAVVIPVIVRNVEWQSAPFGGLQALPAGGKAITEWEPRDRGWQNVAEGIREVVEKLIGESRPAHRFVEPSSRTLAIPGLGSLPPPPSSDVGSAGAGLIALSELMQAPDVRAAVAAFQTDFKAACGQISVIGTWKDLHDRLHELQIRYNAMVQEAPRFPADPAATDRLTDIYECDVQRIIEDVQTVASRRTVVTEETPWVRDLVQAGEELRAAIDGADAHQLSTANWHLSRVLSIQPSRINAQLNAAGKTLRLVSQVHAMERIRDYLVGVDLSTEKVHQFEVGVEALGRLNDSLLSLVTEHDRWQEVDNELRRIDAERDHLLEELELSWPSLKEIARSLFEGPGDQRAHAMQVESSKIESTLASKDLDATRQAFGRFRQQAREAFYRVDATLKTQCDELRTVGGPLAAVLQMLE